MMLTVQYLCMYMGGVDIHGWCGHTWVVYEYMGGVGIGVVYVYMGGVYVGVVCICKGVETWSGSVVGGW